MKIKPPINCPNCNRFIINDRGTTWYSLSSSVFNCKKDCLIQYSYWIDSEEYLIDERARFSNKNIEYFFNNSYQKNYLICTINNKPFCGPKSYFLDFSKSKEEIINQFKLIMTFQ